MMHTNNKTLLLGLTISWLLAAVAFVVAQPAAPRGNPNNQNNPPPPAQQRPLPPGGGINNNNNAPARGPAGPNPVFALLDTDNDGLLSAQEIAASSAVLKGQDRNGDGQLTPREVRPFPPPPGDNNGVDRPQGAAAGRAPQGPNGPQGAGVQPGPRNGNGGAPNRRTQVAVAQPGPRPLNGANGPINPAPGSNGPQGQPGNGNGPAPGPNAGGGPPEGPVFALFDTDADGLISSSEIAAAPAVLKEFDRNGDGQLTPREILPPMGNPGGPGGGPGGAPNGPRGGGRNGGNAAPALRPDQPEGQP